MTNNQTSRVIKFRVWDSQKKYFSSQYDIRCSNGCISNDETVDPHRERFVPQQFIGLFDSTGLEIYEGDIVKYDTQRKDENESYVNLLISPVFTENGKWRIKYGADSYCWHKMTVLGNIFENPELCYKN